MRASGRGVAPPMVCGAAEEVTERVLALTRAGICEVIIHTLAAPERGIEETIRAFAEHLAPVIRRTLARLD